MEGELKGMRVKRGLSLICGPGPSRPHMKPPQRLKPLDKTPVKSKVRLELRPVIDKRMPTIGNNAVFSLKMKDRRMSFEKTNFSDFVSAPPKNLQEVRTVISNEMAILGKELVAVERLYYGRSRFVRKELERIVSDVKLVCGVNTMLKLDSVKRIEAVLKTTDPNLKLGEVPSVRVVRDAFEKVLDFVPDKMFNITKRCQTIFDHLSRYCKCFYDAGFNGHFGTADNYREQIVAWSKVITDSLENISKMATHFRKDRVTDDMFSKEVLDLAESVGARHFSFMMIFVEACANVRKAVFAMSSWLKHDSEYATFIKNDLANLQKSRERFVRAVREAGEKYHSVVYRQTQLENDYNASYDEFTSLKDKELSMSVEMEHLTELCERLQVDADIKEDRLDDLKRLAMDMNPEVLIETWDSITSELRSLRYRLPKEARQLNKLAFKHQVVADKIEHFQVIEMDLCNIAHDLEQAKLNKEQTEKDYNENEKKLELARKILIYKSSADVIRKIYYELPLQSHGDASANMLGSQSDTIEQVCGITANLIENDWQRLYRALPFYPNRGEINIENDIRSIMAHATRDATQHLAMTSLQRWRRFHTRVKSCDVINALRHIKRHDIAYAVDYQINPEAYVVKVETPIDEKPPPVPPHLVPFYRLVERYDELKAANKLSHIPESEWYDFY